MDELIQIWLGWNCGYSQLTAFGGDFRFSLGKVFKADIDQRAIYRVRPHRFFSIFELFNNVVHLGNAHDPLTIDLDVLDFFDWGVVLEVVSDLEVGRQFGWTLPGIHKAIAQM